MKITSPRENVVTAAAIVVAMIGSSVMAFQQSEPVGHNRQTTTSTAPLQVAFDPFSIHLGEEEDKYKPSSRSMPLHNFHSQQQYHHEDGHDLMEGFMKHVTTLGSDEDNDAEKTVFLKSLNDSKTKRNAAAAAAASSSVDHLALASEGHWRAYFDEENSGMVYYYNVKTRTSQWKRPTSTFPVVVLSKKQQKIAKRRLAEYKRKGKSYEEVDWMASLFSHILPFPFQNDKAGKPLATEGSWSAYLDESRSSVFYYNKDTKKSQWLPPTKTFPKLKAQLKRGKKLQPLAKQGPWRAYLEPSAAKVYYYNVETGESQWEVPSPTFPSVTVPQRILQKQSKQRNEPDWVQGLGGLFKQAASVFDQSKFLQLQDDVPDNTPNWLTQFVDDRMAEMDSWWNSIQPSSIPSIQLGRHHSSLYPSDQPEHYYPPATSVSRTFSLTALDDTGNHRNKLSHRSSTFEVKRAPTFSLSAIERERKQRNKLNIFQKHKP